MCIRKGRVGYPLLTTHQPLFFALCFHILTNCSSRNPFILITIRIARGCYLRHPYSCFSASMSQCLCGKPHVLSILRTLCHSQKSQLLCNQVNPASFCKMPGGGVGIPNASTGHPGVGVPLRFPLLESPASRDVEILRALSRHSPLVTRHFPRWR